LFMVLDPRILWPRDFNRMIRLSTYKATEHSCDHGLRYNDLIITDPSLKVEKFQVNQLGSKTLSKQLALIPFFVIKHSRM